MKLTIFTPDATQSSEQEFNLPVFEKLYRSVKAGQETREVIRDCSGKDYKDFLAKKLAEIGNSSYLTSVHETQVTGEDRTNAAAVFECSALDDELRERGSAAATGRLGERRAGREAEHEQDG